MRSVTTDAPTDHFTFVIIRILFLYSKTINNRVRFLPDLDASSAQMSRARAERQAVNTVVQGSAADMMKKASLEVRMAFERGKEHPALKRLVEMRLRVQCYMSLCYARVARVAVAHNQFDHAKPTIVYSARILFQAHDEIVVSAPHRYLHVVARIVQMAMTSVLPLSRVPFPVCVFAGTSLGSLQRVELPTSTPAAASVALRISASPALH
jgi:DNA polymerase I-like protein with 3'-5' exonuclease and polymerase domains